MISLWKNVFDAFPFPVNITGVDNGILFVNRAFERAYGWQIHQIRGLPPHFLLPKNFSRKVIMARLAHMSQEKRPWSGVQENVTSLGAKFRSFLVAVPLSPVPGVDPAGYFYASCPEEERDQMLLLLLRTLFDLAPLYSSSGVAAKDLRIGHQRGDRKRSILGFFELGFSAKQIAHMLGISVSTVNTVRWRERRLPRVVR